MLAVANVPQSPGRNHDVRNVSVGVEYAVSLGPALHRFAGGGNENTVGIYLKVSRARVAGCAGGWIANHKKPIALNCAIQRAVVTWTEP